MTTRAVEQAGKLAQRGFRETAMSLMRHAWCSYREWREARRAVCYLKEMSDWELRDIGLGRSEIESAVYGYGIEESRRRPRES